MEVDDDEQDGVLRRFRGPKDGPEEGSTKVLLYGDSLTAFPGDALGSPAVCYGRALAQGWPRVVVDACGLCGLEAAELVEAMDVTEVEDACGQVGMGLRKLLRGARQKYDMVVLMAGTNDLQEIRSAPAPIATCIKCLHTACHVEGVATVCLSVPPNRFVENPRYRERWARVNELLSTWSQGEGKHEGVALHVDVQQILPYGSESSLWDSDGLHFSQRGADTLGRALLEPLRRAAGARLLPAAAPSALAQPMPMRLKIPGKVEGAEGAVKWLFYGDSLTAGYHGFGRLFAPYAEALGCELQLQEPNELWVCGLSGLEATELEAKKRSSQIRDAVRRTGPGIERLLSEKSFDLAFIMLGTNDLASGQDEETFVAIKKIHEACHHVKLPTVTLSVPPSRAVEKFADIRESRQKVNELLLNWAKETPMTHFVDTGDLLPWSRDSEHWEIDGLHFSRLGSRLLGQRLAQRLAPELRALGARRCKRW